MNYSRAVRIIRAKTGYSQEEFAKKTSIDPSLISRIESGKRTPSKSNLASISKTFSIPFDLIQLLASEGKELKKISEEEANQIGKELLNLLIETQEAYEA